ncbi:MAG: 50S ribosomal protein L29 [Acidobacteria bacterium]|nr:50S ribosomal protein L29 [Acidobacteriota bacterium]
MAKVSELRELETEELEQRVGELDDQVFRLRLQKSMGQADAAYKMRGLRRDRARVKTLLRERELDAAPAAAAEPAATD